MGLFATVPATAAGGGAAPSNEGASVWVQNPVASDLGSGRFGRIAVSRIDFNDDGLVQLADTSEYNAKKSHPF